MRRAYLLVALGALLSLLLGACGARDDAQTADATPVAAYPYPPPYPLPTVDSSYPLLGDTSTPFQLEPGATAEASVTPAAATAAASSATAEATATPEPSAMAASSATETMTSEPSATAEGTATPEPFYTPIPSNTPELPRPTTPISDETQPSRPMSQIGLLSFADPLHGWLFGHACPLESGSCTPEIDATQDGGQTWRRLPAPMIRQPDGTTVLLYYVDQLLFASEKDGWLMASRSLKSGGRWSSQSLLAVTRDGGQTWEEDQHSGDVSVLGYAAGTVWMVDTITTTEKRLRLLLHESADHGRSWQDSEALLPAEATSLRFNRLIRSGPNDAWLTSFPGHAGVVATHDGGRSWGYIANPCPQFSWLAPLDHRRLWMSCSGEPAVGMQERQLYQSRDGGKRWHLIAKSEDLSNNRVSCEGECTLSIGYGGDMQCVSRSRCYMLYQLWLAVSSDGGRTWTSAIDDAVTQGDSPTRDFLFIDEQHGWMAANANVYRTDDGGASWQRIAVP